MSSVSTISKELKLEIENAVISAMQNEVSVVVKNKMQEHIQVHVYNRYAPKYYIRRQEIDGLKDKRNISVKRYGKMGVTISNIARANPRYGGDGRMRIAESIEYGTGIMAQIGARPFFKMFTKDLRQNGAHIDALANGLRRQGINVLNTKK